MNFKKRIERLEQRGISPTLLSKGIQNLLDDEPLPEGISPRLRKEIELIVNQLKAMALSVPGPDGSPPGDWRELLRRLR